MKISTNKKKYEVAKTEYLVKICVNNSFKDLHDCVKSEQKYINMFKKKEIVQNIYVCISV